jgi:hypothetical protein
MIKMSLYVTVNTMKYMNNLLGIVLNRAYRVQH